MLTKRVRGPGRHPQWAGAFDAVRPHRQGDPTRKLDRPRPGVPWPWSGLRGFLGEHEATQVIVTPPYDFRSSPVLPDRSPLWTRSVREEIEAALSRRAVLTTKGERWLRAVMDHTDERTHACFQSGKYLAAMAMCSERRAKIITAQCINAGILEALVYPPRDARLRPESSEWRHGVRILRWCVSSGRDFIAALERTEASEGEPSSAPEPAPAGLPATIGENFHIRLQTDGTPSEGIPLAGACQVQHKIIFRNGVPIAVVRSDTPAVNLAIARAAIDSNDGSAIDGVTNLTAHRFRGFLARQSGTPIIVDIDGRFLEPVRSGDVFIEATAIEKVEEPSK